MSFFNLRAGQGLGFSGSRNLSFGLGPVAITVVEPEIPFIVGGGGGSYYQGHSFIMHDNEYSKKTNDDDEIITILGALIPILE